MIPLPARRLLGCFVYRNSALFQPQLHTDHIYIHTERDGGQGRVNVASRPRMLHVWHVLFLESMELSYAFTFFSSFPFLCSSFTKLLILLVPVPILLLLLSSLSTLRFAAVQTCEQQLLQFRGLSGSLARWLQTAQDQLPSKEANLNTESLQRRVQQLRVCVLADWITDRTQSGCESFVNENIFHDIRVKAEWLSEMFYDFRTCWMTGSHRDPGFRTWTRRAQSWRPSSSISPLLRPKPVRTRTQPALFHSPSMLLWLCFHTRNCHGEIYMWSRRKTERFQMICSYRELLFMRSWTKRRRTETTKTAGFFYIDDWFCHGDEQAVMANNQGTRKKYKQLVLITFMVWDCRNEKFEVSQTNFITGRK